MLCSPPHPCASHLHTTSRQPPQHTQLPLAGQDDLDSSDCILGVLLIPATGLREQMRLGSVPQALKHHVPPGTTGQAREILVEERCPSRALSPDRQSTPPPPKPRLRGRRRIYSALCRGAFIPWAVNGACLSESQAQRG